MRCTMIAYCPAKDDRDLSGILTLQQQNLLSQLPSGEWRQEGFVTVRHTLRLLRRMNRPYPHIVARQEHKIVGYTLVMLPAVADEIPVLQPMFQQMDALDVDGASLAQVPYFVMGQVCIDKAYRGQGLFRGMYQALKEQMKPHFSWCITEIATRNPRSLRAHQKVGFVPLHTYQDATDEWVIVGWKWEENR